MLVPFSTPGVISESSSARPSAAKVHLLSCGHPDMGGLCNHHAPGVSKVPKN